MEVFEVMSALDRLAKILKSKRNFLVCFATNRICPLFWVSRNLKGKKQEVRSYKLSTKFITIFAT